jgi:hypothetical protein
MLCAISLSWAMDSAFASQFKLQGKSAGCSEWVSENLEGWRELDYIPCRLYIKSGPLKEQPITIKFPRMNGTHPGFDDLTNFTASDNVQIIDGPTLFAPDCGDWSYSFTIKVTDCHSAEIRFSARLARGSASNTGSSLKLGGTPTSMGKLQIHKPEPAPYTTPPVKTVPASPMLKIKLTAANSVMVYWPSPSEGWSLQETWPLGSTNWTDMNVTPSDDGTNRFIIVDRPAGNCCYRLVYTQVESGSGTNYDHNGSTYSDRTGDCQEDHQDRREHHDGRHECDGESRR